MERSRARRRRDDRSRGCWQVTVDDVLLDLDPGWLAWSRASGRPVSYDR